MAMPCRPMSPLTRMASSGWMRCGRISRRVFDQADSGGIDEDAIALATIHHFGVAGHDLHFGIGGSRLQGLHHAPERLHRQALFEDETHADDQRTRAAHRQVVDRPMHSHAPDVAAGEKERLHHVRIGREGQCRAVQLEHCAIVLRFQVVETVGEHLLDQRVHQVPAAAVCQQHLRVFRNRDRAA